MIVIKSKLNEALINFFGLRNDEKFGFLQEILMLMDLRVVIWFL